MIGRRRRYSAAAGRRETELGCKFADFVVVDAKIDSSAKTPLDPVVRATAADIKLVVVGGQPVYGDPTLLAQLLPQGTKLDSLTVCGSPKAVYLGQSGAVDIGKSLVDIQASLNAALARGGSSLPDIECC